jgi:NADH-quinone oxidoreductase subunit M
MCTKSANCWYNAFIWYYVKMGLYSVIRWQLPLALAAKSMYIFIGLGIAGVLRFYRSIETKDLKKLLAYSSWLTLD